MKKTLDRHVVIDLVLKQVVKDIEDRDLTAIEELLKDVPLVQLIGYLPEGMVDS